jgi:hypothetical protein
MKKCTGCLIEKEETEFSLKHARKSKRLQSKCKQCLAQKSKIYYTQNKNKPNIKYSDYKRDAKKRNLEFTLSKEEFLTFWQQPCFYCSKSINTIGLDRVDNSKGYKFENLVPCCFPCNQLKTNLTIEQMLMFANALKKIGILN